jgi:hypothetical protein
VAVDDMRATAKWTLAALGAVGAVLISGGPLVAVGQVHGVGHVVIAGAGLLLALAGIGAAIWYTTDVLSPRLVTPSTLLGRKPTPKVAAPPRWQAVLARLTIARRDPLAELRARVTESPELFFGVLARDIAGLLRHRAMEVGLAWQLQAEPGKTEHGKARRANLEKHLQQVSRDASRAEPLVGWLLLAAHAELVRAALRRSRIATIAGGALVIIGAVLFFSVTGSSGPQYVPVLTPAVTATPAAPATPTGTAAPTASVSRAAP